MATAETVLINVSLVLPAEEVPGTVRRCAAEVGLFLPDAVAAVTDTPARLARLDGWGRIAPGLRAALARVRDHQDLPVVRRIWRAGGRVA